MGPKTSRLNLLGCQQSKAGIRQDPDSTAPRTVHKRLQQGCDWQSSACRRGRFDLIGPRLALSRSVVEERSIRLLLRCCRLAVFLWWQ